MTYQQYEDSISLGSPIELYEFVQGTIRWTYKTGDTNLVYNGRDYIATAIKRDRIKQSGDVFKDSMNITLPRDNEFAGLMLTYEPEEVTTLTIRRVQANDPDQEFVVVWKGRVSSAKGSDGGGTSEIVLECESIHTSIRRPGLRAHFEYTCRHTLYGARCGVNREQYRVDGNIIGVSGNGTAFTMQGIASRPNGYFTGGIILFANGASRFIISHIGDQLTVSYPMAHAVGGTLAKAYPGCDHLKETCTNKFGNGLAFGGFPYIPIKNPFGGSSIV